MRDQRLRLNRAFSFVPPVKFRFIFILKLSDGKTPENWFF